MLETIKARLIDDAAKAWKFGSMQIMALAVMILGVWTADPDLIREIIPPRYLHLFLALVIISGMIARLHKKPDQPGDDK